MPIKLALVSAFPPGMQSLNEYGLHLAKEFASRSDVSEVVVISDTTDAATAELDLGQKISVQRIWSFNDVKSAPKILSTLRRTKCDAVIWNLQTATFGDKEIPAALGLIAPAIARLMGIPSGVIAHNILQGVDLESTTLKGQPIRQAVVRGAGKLVTSLMLSATYTTVTLRSYADLLSRSHPTKRVYLVPHGTFDTQSSETPSHARREKRIVTMGKFGTYKRLETLLEAFDIVRKRPGLESYELVVAGTDHPNAKGYLKKVAASRESDPSVHFRGYLAEDEIPEFFSNARLSVFDYSATTGSSGVLHQTASYGAAPVFPSIGDFVDVCREEGLGGFNYLPNDANDMARVMIHALENPGTAEQVANSNKEASLELPLAKVAEFHVRGMTEFAKRTATEDREIA